MCTHSRDEVWTLPPDLIVDLGVGRDRVAARDQGVGEPDERRLFGSITRGLIRTAGENLVETDLLRPPVGERELELGRRRRLTGCDDAGRQ